MRKLAVVFFLMVFLSGCATYKFERGKPPYDGGYTASRDSYMIPEYTVGNNNAVPDLGLAKERFKRRRKKVEHYYKKMGSIENHFKAFTIDPLAMGFSLITGIFRLPFIAVSDYRAAHNPKYKEMLLERDMREEAKETATLKKYKEELSLYVQADLAKEGPVETPQPVAEPVKAAGEPAQEAAIPAPAVVEPVKEQAPPAKVKPESRMVKSPAEAKAPVAVIIAKPVKGPSPLTVRFYGSKSYAPGSRIVSYSWDFGDTAVSNKANPVNTYYSWSTDPKSFTVTLTVKNREGETATASTTIEVINN